MYTAVSLDWELEKVQFRPQGNPWIRAHPASSWWRQHGVWKTWFRTSNKVLFSLLPPWTFPVTYYILPFNPWFLFPYLSPSLRWVALSKAGSMDRAVEGFCALIPKAGNPAPPLTPSTYFPRACFCAGPSPGCWGDTVHGEPWVPALRSRAEEGDQKVKKQC